jgi:hypothetical protein
MRMKAHGMRLGDSTDEGFEMEILNGRKGNWGGNFEFAQEREYSF